MFTHRALLAQKLEQRRYTSPQRLAGAALLQQLQVAQMGSQAAEPQLQAPPSLHEVLGAQQPWQRPQLPALVPGHHHQQQQQQQQKQLLLQRQAAEAGVMQQLLAAGALPGAEAALPPQPTLLRGSVPNLPPVSGLQVAPSAVNTAGALLFCILHSTSCLLRPLGPVHGILPSKKGAFPICC